MIRKDLIITVLATFCLTATLFIVLPTRSIPSAGEYDPWADIDENGKINMYDIGYTAQRFGTSGDTTKNVTVTNWPVTNQQTVFYAQNTTYGWTGFYNASGYGHMHLVWEVSGLSESENVAITFAVRIINPQGGYVAFTLPLLDTITPLNSRGTLSVPVLSETFRFGLLVPAGTVASVYFAFYLTYA
jgi:hypothetical protein